MAFSSVHTYLDLPNWNEPQSGHQNRAICSSGEINEANQLQPRAGPSLARPCSMAERARLEKVAQPEVGLKCPRCDSTNTKFCYFNNYSLSQPRHFCKTCRRYWTRGGALRNVPVGGGCRRNKRGKGGGAIVPSSGVSGGAIVPSFQPAPRRPFITPPHPLLDYELRLPMDRVDFQWNGSSELGLERWRIQQVQKQFSLLAAQPSSASAELFPLNVNFPRQYWQHGGGGDGGINGGVGDGDGWTDFQGSFM